MKMPFGGRRRLVVPATAVLALAFCAGASAHAHVSPPVVLAKEVATLDHLSGGRFTLGVGSGENLNEHVVGGRWPTVSRRQQMLKEAIQIIRELFTGELIDWKGEYFEVDSARIWDVPETPVAIATAVSGERSVHMFAPLSDHLIAVEPIKDLVDAWHDARRATGLPGEVRVIGQIPICWDPDRDAAVQRAHDQFRWFGGGWAVNADLPTTAGFEGATQFVRPEDVADSIPCGPDLDAIVEAVRKYWEAGFTDIALVQIGDEGQELFLKEAAGSLLEKLRTQSH